jgi:predicted dinucleotide-binding enzyme
MKTGIMGSGNIGSITARLFANAGHQVAIIIIIITIAVNR